MAGTPGFGFRSGQVWAVHVAWSGNHEYLAERLPEGAGAGGEGVLGGGELLLPGEVRLAPGESYSSPWLAFAWSDAGLDGLSARMHRWLRSRPGHPARPRPLVLNTWEAVYFDHDLERLTELAERAARVGVERFVLDDGWFHGRQGESGGLGDWWVDEKLWPNGLRPLADRVRALGMEFGLWVEPEMVSPDSELARTHPDWVLAAPDRRPRLWRNQWVLDVAHPEAAAYLVERLDAVIGESGAGYLKWDHNRDLHESVHVGPDGVAGCRRARPDPGGVRADGRAASPQAGAGDRVLRLRRRPDRPGHPGADRPGLGLGHQRPARAAGDPALDRPAGAAGAGRHPCRATVRGHHRPVRRSRVPLPSPRCSGTPGSSGT